MIGGCAAQTSQPQTPRPVIEYRLPRPTPTETTPLTAPTVPEPTSTSTPVPIVTPDDSEGAGGTGASVTNPVPAPAAGGGYDGRCGDYPDDVTRWWPVITQYPWDACTVLYIINRESGGLNVYNYEGSGACGVMQLLPCMFPDDGAANIDYGYWHKYVPAGGWGPWQVMD